jgi:acetyltransferase-like isoleucine patch superfamily enzyme
VQHRTAWVRTLWNAAKNGSFKVHACRNTHIRLRRGSMLGPGRLVVGCQWDGGFHRPTQLVMRADARCIVSGRFQIFEAAVVWVNAGATLTLGSGYANSSLNLSVFQSVSIGDDAAIAENVCIRDADNHGIADRPNGARPIVIGNHVWIGMNATILKGVTIGDGAVVAAGAVVNRDVPAGMLAAGVPAKPIRRIEWTH